ncbi:Zn-ribbon domain-containing OB-fold protein [Sneathiella sp.]|uniref:Zn-ribbon domain-containing OB-fold protein n=1 Tax=Sneathiella sp. TaxID=1964365 RepID=UPI00260301D9|nr:Zn-ribbon domain-containing OB-fold protein [Sneathiella sp.]MDF2368508.1 Zn-ribbon domain-containing OB-fold protein [Sneathiella sp.]
MHYMPEAVPGPDPSFDDATYWTNCQEKKLTFQRCGKCQTYRHPPGPFCPQCHSDQIEWVEAPEEGELFSFTVIHHPAHQAVRERVPYNVVLVSFPTMGGVRVISNVIDAEPDELKFGMKLRLVWGQAGNGQTIPLFKKA